MTSSLTVEHNNW